MSLSIFLSGVLAFSNPTKADSAITIRTAVLPKVSHSAFSKGEKLSYELSYGWIDAGEAVIEISNQSHYIDDREVLHVIGTGTSKGAFDWFFKVRDRYETYLDAEGVFPWRFVRNIHEGGFELKQDYQFNPIEGKVVTDKDQEFEVPFGVQDMISSFYRARANDYSKVKPGDIFEFKAFVDNEVWPLKIKYLRDEEIEVEDITYDCMVFVPVVQSGRIFKNEEDMKVWITKDKNKIPVFASAEVLVGSIDMKLKSYEGLSNPVAIIED